MDIYVGNLSYELTEEELKETFEAFGQVESVKVIRDLFSGRSRGFGFVTMPDTAEGEAAINQLNGSEMKGRALRVSQARPRAGGRRGGGRRGGGRRF